MANHTIEQALEEQGHAIFQIVGCSMEPLLHNRESSVVIEKVSGDLKPYDVALFRRPTNGRYVLHRVYKVRERDYLICGDNCCYREPVPKEWVLGVMTGFFAKVDSEFTPCDDPQYQEYLRTVNRRYWILLVTRFPGRVLRKLRKVISRKR